MAIVIYRWLDYEYNGYGISGIPGTKKKNVRTHTICATGIQKQKTNFSYSEKGTKAGKMEGVTS